MLRPRGLSAVILVLFLCGALLAAACGGGAGGGAAKGSSTGFGGAQDAGYFRQLLANGQVPPADAITYEGFLAEHDFPLPSPQCADLLCMHGIVGLGPAAQAGHRTLLQMGLNSPEDASAFTPEYKNLALVIDVSGSMSGRKLEYVKTGLLKLVDELESNDVVSLVVYDSYARIRHKAQRVDGKRGVLRTKIRQMSAGGSTNINAGMVKGYEQAQKFFLPAAANRVILLTDGQANTGVTDLDAIAANSKVYNDQGIGITTIGVGLGYNQELMLRLARLGGGNNYFLDDPQQSKEVFVEELASLYTLIGRDLHIEISPLGAFRSLGAYGAGTLALQPDGTLVLDVPSIFYSVRRQGVLLVEMEVVGVGTSPHSLGEITYQYTRNDNGAVEGGTVTPLVWVDAPYDPGAEQYDTVSTEKALVVLETVKGFKQASAEYHDSTQGWQVAEATLLALESFVGAHQVNLQDPEIADDLDLILQFLENVRP